MIKGELEWFGEVFWKGEKVEIYHVEKVAVKNLFYLLPSWSKTLVPYFKKDSESIFDVARKLIEKQKEKD